MIKRSKRMGVVLMLAEQKEQEAGEQLAEYQKMVNLESDQLNELEGYESDYLDAYTQGQGELQTEQMIRYSELIVRLKDALTEQRGKVAGMDKNLQQLRLYWHMIHQKRQAVSDMIERMKAGEAHELEGRLQKELDDLVQNRPKY